MWESIFVIEGRQIFSRQNTKRTNYKIKLKLLLFENKITKTMVGTKIFTIQTSAKGSYPDYIDNS